MKKKLILLVTALGMTACGNSNVPAPVAAPQPYVQPGAQTPVVVNQAPAAASDGPGLLTGAVLGGLGGYMLGRNATAPAPTQAPAPVVVRRTVINNYVSPPVPPAPVVTAPAPARVKPSYATAYSSVKPATPPRPSYSSFSKGKK